MVVISATLTEYSNMSLAAARLTPADALVFPRWIFRRVSTDSPTLAIRRLMAREKLPCISLSMSRWKSGRTFHFFKVMVDTPNFLAAVGRSLEVRTATMAECLSFLYKPPPETGFLPLTPGLFFGRPLRPFFPDICYTKVYFSWVPDR